MNKDNQSMAQPGGTRKKLRILCGVIVLLFLCAAVRVAVPLVKISKLNLNGSLDKGRTVRAVPGSFYFRKAQWLADARTAAYAFRYLLEPEPSITTNPAKVAYFPHVKSLDAGLSAGGRVTPYCPLCQTQIIWWNDGLFQVPQKSQGES